jgi:hypothetical protein
MPRARSAVATSGGTLMASADLGGGAAGFAAINVTPLVDVMLVCRDLHGGDADAELSCRSTA